MLSVKEVAALTGKTDRWIKQLAASNKLPCKKTVNSNNRPKYLFSLSALAELDPTLPQRYLEQHAPAGVADIKNAQRGRGRPRKDGSERQEADKPRLEDFSAEERGEIAFWTQAVNDWRGYRAGYRDKAAADEAWLAQFRLDHPDVHITRSILYARQRAVLDDDLAGLVDGRGKARRGYCKISPEVWETFLSFYLDEREYRIAACYDFTQMWAEMYRPDLLPLPDYTTFYRHIETDVPEAVKVLGRKGTKACKDRCAPYARRIYSDLQSNDYWIADNHTFDVITQSDGGKTHRLYLTAFFDARSGIFTGCYVTEAPSSQSTLIALRRGILKYGIPKNIYVDNGREFLTFDMGGLGHRTKKLKNGKERFDPPPVFERLGIKMTNALVRNARAKLIERQFVIIKDRVSRLFDTFCGGNVLEKPENLKYKLKDGKVILDGDFTEAIETLLEGWFNERAYGGAVVEDRGKPCIEVWREHLAEKRVPRTPEDLNLMLMRSTRKQKIDREGVHLLLHGKKLWYYDMDFVLKHQREEVYLRYDPDDLRRVRVYNLQDQFMAELPAFDEVILHYGATSDDVGRVMALERRYDKMVKDDLTRQTEHFRAVYGKLSAFDIMMAKARQNREFRLEQNVAEKPNLIHLVGADETPLDMAVGAENVVDFGRMTANAIKQHEQHETERSFEDDYREDF